MQNSTSRVFSGAQPSGEMTIGNYIGAIKPWLELQKSHECLFCVVDLHALTANIAAETMQENIIKTFALFLACGLDPTKQTIFIQSHIAAHSELAWLLQSITHMGELNRMTQFKDKSQRYEKNINAGLFTYPTLMAADILLYNANIVPVGDDQKQHLELTRNLAQRFNLKAGEFFNIPEPYILKHGSRIMSLQDPGKKMSKSDPNQNSYIGLLDHPDLITKKIKRSVTDSSAIIAKDPNRPGITNLITLYESFANESTESVIEKYQGQGYGNFKRDLAEIIIETLSPIQKKFADLIKDQSELKNIMQQGASKAQIIANQNISIIKQKLGLWI